MQAEVAKPHINVLRVADTTGNQLNIQELTRENQEATDFGVYFVREI